MCDIEAGDFVECVDDRPGGCLSWVMPELGALYTVVSVSPEEGGHRLQLRELAPICRWRGGCACRGQGWEASRFRKVYRPRSELVTKLAARVRQAV